MSQDSQLTIAIASDIHGNASALRAVLEDIRRVGPDETVIAGDLVLFGPRPAEALALVQDLERPAIYGNTDRFISHRSGPDWVEPSVVWVEDRIGVEGVEYLRELPFDHRITPPGGSADDDLLIVHATPRDENAVLITETDPSGADLTAEQDAKDMLDGARAGLIVYGHIHYASAGAVDGQPVASIGSVGFPFDGDHRAAYALARWDGGAWALEHRRVPYDHESAAAELAATDAPFAGFMSERLHRARFVPRPTG
jgi:predicted phosphodiesterase